MQRKGHNPQQRAGQALPLWNLNRTGARWGGQVRILARVAPPSALRLGRGEKRATRVGLSSLSRFEEGACEAAAQGTSAWNSMEFLPSRAGYATFIRCVELDPGQLDRAYRSVTTRTKLRSRA